MIEIKLVDITEIDEKNFMEYTKEWKENNEPIFPSVCEQNGKTYNEWIKSQFPSLNSEPKSNDHIKSETFYLVEDNGYIIGAIDLRFDLTAEVLKHEGHLSFGVRPAERRKGYAFIMLKQSLNKLRLNRVNKALITTNRDNKAAKNTIKKIGGKLENSYEMKGNVIDRYWVEL